MSVISTTTIFVIVVIIGLSCNYVTSSESELKQGTENEMSKLQTIFTEIDAQVEHQLTQEAVKERKQTAKQAKMNVGLKNMLDLKTMTLDVVPGKAKEQPRHVVAAFLQISWEAIQRGKFALAQLGHIYKVGTDTLKANDHNLKAWISNHFSLAQNRIRTEEERVGKLTDEVNHLQHVYQDAVAKEKSYQEQAAHLVSEHQLQSTPPLVPAVAAAAIPESQYQQVIGKLEQFRQSALTIMQETALAISTRQHLIEQGSQWIKKSKAALQSWVAQQNKLASQRLQQGKRDLAQLQTRIKNIKIITDDAQSYYKDYQSALKQVDIKNRIKVLNKQAVHYKNITLTNTYDKVKMDSFLSTVKLEVDALKGQLKKMKGSSKVTPPPAAWGVLAGFHPPAIHQNTFPSPVYRVTKPDGQPVDYLSSPPGGVYYNSPASRGVGLGNAFSQKQNEEAAQQLPANMPIVVSNSILAPTPLLSQGEAKTAEPKFREQMSPPPLPDFPAPPTNE